MLFQPSGVQHSNCSHKPLLQQDNSDSLQSNSHSYSSALCCIARFLCAFRNKCEYCFISVCRFQGFTMGEETVVLLCVYTHKSSLYSLLDCNIFQKKIPNKTSRYFRALIQRLYNANYNTGE